MIALKSTFCQNMEPIKLYSNDLELLDQTRLPENVIYRKCVNSSDVRAAILNLQVRGAPLIGIAAAYGLWLSAQEIQVLNQNAKEAAWKKELDCMRVVRPTAVNLKWAVDRIEKETCSFVNQSKFSEKVLESAKRLHEEDKKTCDIMADFGSSLFQSPSNVITYCNTGALATGGTGTAFGVIRRAFERRLVKHVYCCETRPLLQGSRLTAWECLQNLIPVTVLCDSMIVSLFKSRKIDFAFVGADRIAANGDVANKIGTSQLALICKHFGVPFYVVAPESSIDLTMQTGADIKIENRDAREILGDYYCETVDRISVFNPAFDITPACWIAKIITEKGIFDPGYIHAIYTGINRPQQASYNC